MSVTTILTLNIYKNAESELCCYKLKLNCAVINCSNSTCKLKKWKQEICYEHNDFGSRCKRKDCIHCIPLFKLYCFPIILSNAKLRTKWIRALKRQNKDKTVWKPSESDRVCSIHFVGSAYEANSVPTLNLGYEVEEKKARRTLIRQPLPKKSKIKENNDIDDEDDCRLWFRNSKRYRQGNSLPISLLLLNHSLQSHAALLITGQLPL